MKFFESDWQLPPKLQALEGMAVANSESQIFLAGGIGVDGIVKKQFSTVTMVKVGTSLNQGERLGKDTEFAFFYNELPSMLEARAGCQLVLQMMTPSKFSIFAIGGNMTPGLNNFIEKYSSEKGAWERIEIMNHVEIDSTNGHSIDVEMGTLSGHSCTLLPDGTIYIMGGRFTTDHKSKIISSVFQFNTYTSTLKRSCSMNERRTEAKAFLATNLSYVYIFGGTTEKKAKQKEIASVEKLKIGSNQTKWEIVAPLQSGRSGFGGY